MAKLTDKQVLQLLLNHIHDLYNQLPSESTGSSDLDIYDAGRRSVLDSVSSALNFYQNYDFD